ncbi:hypothetical protein BZL30_1108 [Mycobacterium kansasii]|uniref:Uncharacterized protein n=1 Tax=Mycobacterium kansasii TaxID=1768 RepID=A0A1V3XSI2_MYCKA|nr:hypothetical protein BZL30_1108 [Mycobacterium kansasii]
MHVLRVTAVSSTTTPAALTLAWPAALPMSSTEAAASRARAATSSRRPNSPRSSGLPHGDRGYRLPLHLTVG